MPSIINSLFEPTQSQAIQKLWEDRASRFLIQKEIGKKLLDKDVIVLDLPLTQIMFLTSLSDFASSENECYEVAEVVHWGINHKDILPLVSEHNGKELAYRCLISLGFFRTRIEERSKRYGSPSCIFYRNVGKKTFISIGKQDIGEHFYSWENFLSEFFV